jgi:hypothetical protein
LSEIQYEYSHHGSIGITQCDDFAEALDLALSDLETGEAWPTRILDGNTILWFEKRPFTTGESLENLRAIAK